MIRIVIADDDIITRMDLKEILTQSGYDVVGEAADGIDCVELCRELKPDVALVDIKMPIVDGLTAAKMIHKEQPEIALIMVTAYSDKELINSAGEFGVCGYVVKPVDERMLIPTIEIAKKRSDEIKNLMAGISEKEKKLEERKYLEKAKGILIKNNGLSEEEAFQYLRKVSMNKRKSLVEVSKMIIESDKLM